jgi:hypothetical protein
MRFVDGSELDGTVLRAAPHLDRAAREAAFELMLESEIPRRRRLLAWAEFDRIAFFELPNGSPRRSDAGEESQRAAFVQREPNRLESHRRVFREVVQGHAAATADRQPTAPVRRRNVSDVGDAFVRLLAL